MKNILLIATCALFFFGCNMNPSKEARIQELETKIEQIIDKVSKLESRVQILEEANKKLLARNIELEK